MKFTLPAGEYFVADPCHVMGRARYESFLGRFFQIDNADVIEADKENPAFFIATGFGGDGVFDGVIREAGGAVKEGKTKTQFKVPVDAGMVGLIPTAWLSNEKLNFAMNHTKVRFAKPVQVSVSQDNGMTSSFEATDGKIKTIVDFGW